MPPDPIHKPKTQQTYRHSLRDYITMLLMIACFPLNPLVLFKLIEPVPHDVLTILGVIIWAVGMVFVLYPFFYFRMKGDVRKGDSFVKTNRMVSSGLYSVVRHVQYTGGIMSIFLATPLLYPHWIFIAMGIPGILLMYLSMKKEDQLLIGKFGKAYSDYIGQVPAMNVLTGIYRKLKRKGS